MLMKMQIMIRFFSSIIVTVVYPITIWARNMNEDVLNLRWVLRWSGLAGQS